MDVDDYLRNEEIMKQVLRKEHGSETLGNNDTTWSTSQIVTLCLIVISLILHLFTFTIMAYLGGIGRVTNAKKKRVDRMNTTAMVLSMLTTLVNIAITSFSSKLNLNKWMTNLILISLGCTTTYVYQTIMYVKKWQFWGVVEDADVSQGWWSSLIKRKGYHKWKEKN